MIPKLEEENGVVLENDVKVPIGKLEALNKEVIRFELTITKYN